jgi:hypothetical protein
VLHDLHWPGRPFANIDHIAIGPSGVFVIDSKNWSGDVVVRDGVLRQNGNRRSDECEGAASATAAVAAFLEPQHRSLVMAVLCLVDQVTPETQPRMAHVVGLAGLIGFLEGQPQRLSAWDVGRIGDYLRQLLTGPRSPAMKTTAALATAGVAPPEPLRSSRRPVARTASRRPRRPRRRSAGSDSLGWGLIRVAVLVVFALVVLPRMLPTLTDAITTRPSVTSPSVVQPTPTNTAKNKTSKTPATKTTAGQGKR